MIQIYHGDGKGKTTASVGLLVRALGQGIPALFVQFLKDGSSGEVRLLRQQKGVQMMHPEVFHGFVSRMSNEELEETRVYYQSFLGQMEEKIQEMRESRRQQAQPQNVCEGEKTPDIELIVVLDEVLHAVNYRLISEEELCRILQTYKDCVEFVLTGRSPSNKLLQMADYVTEMRKIKHPFDHGVTAREGIEM